MSTDDTIITWDMREDGGFGESYPRLDRRWIPNRPAVIGPDGLLVAPTRSGTSIGEDGAGPGPGTEAVTAAFIDPDTRQPLPTWVEATDPAVLTIPGHVVRLGPQVHVKGVLGGTPDAGKHIGYLAKYLTKSITATVGLD